MNVRPLAISALVCTLLVPLAAARAPQDAGPDQRPMVIAGSATEAELVVRYFTPSQASAAELKQTVESLFGDRVTLFRMRDGDDYKEFAGRHLDRIARVGETLIIRDRLDRAEALVRTLAELDKVTRIESHTAQATLALETLEYTPKHIGLSSVQSALRSYERQIQLRPMNMMGGPQDVVRNITIVQERSLVIVREEPARLAEIKGLLARLDVPAPEVVITCWLVRGLTSGDAATALPEALATNLKKLVPMAGYEQMAVGVIRSSVMSGNGIRLQAEVSGDMGYSLALDPAAYDSASGELSLAKCQFELSQTNVNKAEGAPNRQSHHQFQTQVTLRPGEYTVLGTVGGDPVFVVLRLSKA